MDDWCDNMAMPWNEFDENDDESHTHPRNRPMAAPSKKPLNPDHLRLITDLLADPSKVMCPICGERGFWDNRSSKPSETSPDFKCKNKACVGATPMKRKSPYAVWLPDDFAPEPPTPSKRLTGPGPAPDGPPAHHRDAGVPEGPDTAGEGAGDAQTAREAFTPKAIDEAMIAKRELIESAYRWALDISSAAQWEDFEKRAAEAESAKRHPLQHPHRPTAESIQAGAATLLIQAEKRGAI